MFDLAGIICIAVFVKVASYIALFFRNIRHFLIILIVWLIKYSLMVSVVTLSIHMSAFYFIQTVFHS